MAAAAVDRVVVDTGEINFKEFSARRAAGLMSSGFCFALAEAFPYGSRSGRDFLPERGATVEIAVLD